MVGVTQCSSGPVCANGAASVADGTACGSGLTCDAGTCVASRTVAGTRLVTRWTTEAGASPACSNAAPCRTTAIAPDVLSSPYAQIAALVTDGAGGFRRYAGTFSPTGAYEIPGVPTGPYVLELVDGAGVRYAIETSASTVDLGYDVLGRDPLTAATLPTSVTLDLTGLEPWAPGHELQLASANADLWDVPRADGAILDLQVAGTIVEDWFASDVGSPLNLLDTADPYYVFQLPAYTATGGAQGLDAYAYKRVATAAAPLGITLVDGAPATITAALAAVSRTASLTGIDWKVTQFEQEGAGLAPASATPLPDPHELVVTAAAYAQNAAAPLGRGGTPEMFRMVRAPATPDVTISSSLVYGQFLDEALWSEWRSATYTLAMSYTAAGAATPVQVPASVGRRDAMLPAPPSPIVPAVGTVRNAAIGGQPALGAIAVPGTTPTLTWAAPSVGTPTHYRVAIHEVYASGGATATKTVATWLVPASRTSLAVPANVLQPGKEYFVEITAYARAADTFDTAPLRTPAVFSHATTLSSQFTP
jgi:hypothetical protein